MNKTYNICSNMQMIEAMENKFLIKFRYRIDNKIYVSKKYGIVIRNLNEIENDILTEPLSLKIYKILMLFDDVNDLFDNDKLSIVRDKYLLDIANYDNDTFIRLNLEGFNQNIMFDNIIKVIKEEVQNIDSCDIVSESKKIAHSYLETCLVIYSENIELIYSTIKKSINITDDDINDYDKFNDFIVQYMELWNAINFKQYSHLGIMINPFTTRLDLILYMSKLENLELHDECANVFRNPIQIDINNEVLFYFILNRFHSYTIDNNNRILLYFSLLELMLTHKQKNCQDVSISTQLCENIIECVKKYGELSISKKEIKELYNYRSLLVHGNLEDIPKTLKKVRKCAFASFLIKLLEIDENEENIYYVIDLIRIRMLEIFSYIYKIYCTDEIFIKKLKNGISEE